MTLLNRSYGRHELLFHVLYGNNQAAMTSFIIGSCQRLYTLSGNEKLLRLQADLASCAVPIAPDRLRAMFFLFLNVDPVLKDFLTDSSNANKLAECFCTTSELNRNTEALMMLQSKQATPGKLRNFFTTLHRDIAPRWLQNTQAGEALLVKICREEYLSA